MVRDAGLQFQFGNVLCVVFNCKHSIYVTMLYGISQKLDVMEHQI